MHFRLRIGSIVADDADYGWKPFTESYSFWDPLVTLVCCLTCLDALIAKWFASEVCVLYFHAGMCDVRTHRGTFTVHSYVCVCTCTSHHFERLSFVKAVVCLLTLFWFVIRFVY